ncbi:MAG: ribonuclease Y [Christensenellaceae bacterium]|jgi:ribonuclease Y|nr:ribonuclease Y [Christensenellaceae bacterium]
MVNLNLIASLNTGLAIGLIVLALVLGLAGGYFANGLISKSKQDKSKMSANQIVQKALAEAGAVKKEAILEAKEEVHKLKVEADNELRARRAEVQKIEDRILSREEQIVSREAVITAKETSLDKEKENLEKQKEGVVARLAEIDKIKDEEVSKLEKISGLTKSEAKKQIVDELVDSAKQDAVKFVKQIEEDARADAEKKARDVITNAVQRCSTDHSNEITVSAVVVPSDEIKGRLIGREGRNIRSIEAATGVDLIIDDTPETITLSSFDPYRREIAKMAIEKLIADGRINPNRIEELVERAKKELDTEIKEIGEEASFDAKVHGLNPELIKHLGRLKFRTSYGQNVLRHSVEVSLLAGLLATELGANEQIARRGGLLHDIGKATDHEVEGTHTQIGVELARKFKESEAVVHCIEAHHFDVPFKSVEAILVQVADAISSSRPGARRENIEGYVKRLRDLEDICIAKKGVDKAYAISAGREVRVIVKPDQISDADAVFMAKEIAKEVEEKLQYPGEIKVNVIRETRVVETAR